MAKRKMRLRGWIAIVFAAALIIWCLSSLGQLRQSFFPLDYQEEVNQACLEYRIDPWLVMAIIREESGFQNEAASSAGATGLMQLMPGTAAWVIEKADFDFSTEAALTEPLHNIEVGVWYFSWLLERYGGMDYLPHAVAAYNAGHATVDCWLADAKWDGSESTLDDIPYPETAKYVEYVLRSYEYYQRLYG